MIKNQLRAWLVLFRGHTAILEAPIAALGAALSIGTFWSPEVALWGLFGVIYHYAGYGMNSYLDWANGYDKEDPNKSHHPLNTGEISPSACKKVVYGLYGIMILYAIVLLGINLAGFVVLASIIVTSMTYNAIGKEIEHKYLLVAYSHTAVFILAYFSYEQTYGFIVWFGVVAYFVHHVFQILVSGDVKDAEQDESGIIKDMGMDVTETDCGKKILEVSPRVVVASYIISIIESVIVLGILAFEHPPTSVLVITVGLMGWMLIEVDGVISEGVYNRQRRVSAMSRKELAGLWMIFASFTTQLGVESFIFMAALSIAYFIPVSVFMWGQLTPDV